MTQLRAAGVTAKGAAHGDRGGWLSVDEPTVVVVAGSPKTWRQQRVDRAALPSTGSDGSVTRPRPGCTASTVHETTRSSSRCARRPRGTRMPRHDRSRTVVVGSPRRRDGRRQPMLRRRPARSSTLAVPRVRPTARLEAAIDSAVRWAFGDPVSSRRRLDELRGRGRRGARALDRTSSTAAASRMLGDRVRRRCSQGSRLPRRERGSSARDGRLWHRSSTCASTGQAAVEVSGRRGPTCPGRAGNGLRRALGDRPGRFWPQLRNRASIRPRSERRRVERLIELVGRTASLTSSSVTVADAARRIDLQFAEIRAWHARR